jgi:phage-related tail fiber protein
MASGSSNAPGATYPEVQAAQKKAETALQAVEALKVAIMSGQVTAQAVTSAGETICTSDGQEIFAVKNL